VSALVLFAAPTEEPITVDRVKVHCQIDASQQEPAPGAITVALITAAGNVNAGVHRYLATFCTATGETQAGIISAPVTNDGGNGQNALSAIPTGGDLVTARKLYRTAAGGAAYLLLATIANNSATTYTDNLADSTLGAGAPTVNTTDDWLLGLLIRSARTAAESIMRRALITQTWDLFLDHFPGWEQYIPLPTTQSISSINYVDTNGDTQLLDPSKYFADLKSEPARITPAFGLIWPYTRWRNNAVTIRFTCGYGAAADVPEGVKAWMLIRIKTLWDNRAALSVDTRITMVQLPPEFVDGLLMNFAANDFCWAVDG
jgi:uncharacterized phiE125 gp8 family phage protein